MEQIERIQYMEQMLDRATEALDGLIAALDKYDATRDAFRALSGYYGSEEWKADFHADEAGLLPADLKRGVLSEDAVWDLFTDDRELTARMLETAAATIRQEK